MSAAVGSVDANTRRHRAEVAASRGSNNGNVSRHVERATKEERRNVAAINKARRRFVTFNTFVDAVGRYLPASDREVWHVLFRFADAATNVAEVRLADIAARLGRHTRTTSRSVDRLCRSGLVERMKRGTRQGGPSRYLVDPEPTRHLDVLRRAWEAGQGETKRAARRRGRPSRCKSGKFTT